MTLLIIQNDVLWTLESKVLTLHQYNPKCEKRIQRKCFEVGNAATVAIWLYSTPPLLWDTSFYTFSLLNLHQIKNPMVVFKSAHHEDSKTPPTCLIWWSFGWDIWGLSFLGNWALPFTLKMSVNSSWNSKIRGSFGIACLNFQRSNKGWKEIKF